MTGFIVFASITEVGLGGDPVWLCSHFFVISPEIAVHCEIDWSPLLDHGGYILSQRMVWSVGSISIYHAGIFLPGSIMVAFAAFGFVRFGLGKSTCVRSMRIFFLR